MGKTRKVLQSNSIISSNNVSKSLTCDDMLKTLCQRALICEQSVSSKCSTSASEHQWLNSVSSWCSVPHKCQCWLTGLAVGLAILSSYIPWSLPCHYYIYQPCPSILLAMAVFSQCCTAYRLLALAFCLGHPKFPFGPAVTAILYNLVFNIQIWICSSWSARDEG
jgi:hypothetical protein